MDLDDFRGEVLRGDDWRGRDFRGQRVAVIAPGREAARILPQVVRTARFVKVFQEEADWVVPRLVPPRLGRLYLRLQVGDAWTRRLLTPDSRWGSRRTAHSTSYYAAVQQPNCKLIAWPVYAIVERGVRTAEGIEHRVDCIVIGDSSVLADERDSGSASSLRKEASA